MTTMRDVAEEAGVSTATVSRVLGGAPNVRESTRRTVMAAIDTLNYEPTRLARSLRNRSAQTIGVIVPDMSNSFYGAIVDGVEQVAYDRGYCTFICNSYRCRSAKSSTCTS